MTTMMSTGKRCVENTQVQRHTIYIGVEECVALFTTEESNA